MARIEILWDVDEAVLVIGPDVEVKGEAGPDRLVAYLRSKGCEVVLTDHDAGTTVVLGPTPA